MPVPQMKLEPEMSHLFQLNNVNEDDGVLYEMKSSTTSLFTSRVL